MHQRKIDSLLCLLSLSLSLAIKRPLTRSAAVRHWHNLSLSAYERDLVTNEKIQFRSLDLN